MEKMKVSSHENSFEFFRLNPFLGDNCGDWHSTVAGCYAGKTGVKFHSFSLPSIPSIHLRVSALPNCQKKRLMPWAEGVGAPCKKYLPTVPSLKGGPR